MKKNKAYYSGNMIIVSFLTILLVFIFALGLTGAYFHNLQEINGRINLSSFKVDTLGILKSESGELNLMLKTKDGNKQFEIEMASPDDEYEIVNPTISSSKKVSPVYIRSKLSMTDYYGNELSENEIKEVFNSIPTYSEDWIKNGDWYYLTTSDIEKDNMTVYEGNEEVKLFETTKFTFNQSDELDNIFELLKEINLNLKIEYIEASEEGYSMWFEKEDEIDKEFGVDIEEDIVEEVQETQKEEEKTEVDEKIEMETEDDLEKEVEEVVKEENEIMTLEEVEKEVEIKTEEKVVKKTA